jgi:hypothetical protein
VKTAPAIALLAAFFLATSVEASMTVRRSQTDGKKLDVTIVREPLSNVTKALQFYLPERIELVVSGDPLVTYRGRELTPDTALRLVAQSAGITVNVEHDRYWLRDMKRTTGVTLDVKDEDVRVILKSMQQQCGIRNLVIDNDVQGKGTFLFTDVPCAMAFRTVLASFGLRISDSYANDLIAVAK